MNKFLSLSLALCLVLFAGAASAKIESLEFANPQMEKDYRILVNELRCLVCQNQNLADSNAELAQDLRHQVYEMLNKGSSRKDIVDYMVARYGDFVMYKPPVKSTTYLLWFGPLVLLVLALVVVVMFMRKQKQNTPKISEQAQKKAHHLLDD